MADTVLLAQLLALCGFVLWFFGASDWAGFAVVGGSVAGMLSVFAFMLFGILSWFWGAAAFWRTFHPLNLVLAMCAGAGYTIIVHGGVWTVLASAFAGLVAAVVGARFLPNHPRAWIALCIAVLSLRYVVPWRFSGIAAAAVAVLIFSVWARRNFLQRVDEQSEQS